MPRPPMDTRPIWEQRAELGFTTPTAAEKRYVWSELSVPQANIFAEKGGYRPYRLVARAHDHPARVILTTGGVRGSKSLSASMEGVAWVPHSELIWIGAESYDLGRQEFEYMAEALTSLGWTDDSMISMPKPRYQPCALDTDSGCRVETRSLHDITTFVARAPDFIIISEPGQAPPATLAKSRERLSTRRGRLWLAGTFEDVKEAWMEDVWNRWVRWPNRESGKSFSIPSWINTAVFPGGKNDPEIQALRDSYATFNEFLLRVVGVPVPASALVIGEYWNPRRNVIENLAFQPVRDGRRAPVELAVDPGFGGGSHYVIEAMQWEGDNKFIIDEVAVETLVHEQVINLCRQRPWWKHVVGGAIDPWAGGSHVYGAISPMDAWWTHGRVRLRLPPRWSVEDTVGRLCNELREPVTGDPRLFVNPKATRFIWEMAHWRKRRTAGGTYAEPSKNNCDASKAVAYWLSDRYNRAHVGDSVRPTVGDYPELRV